MRSSRKSSLASFFLDTTHREAVRPAVADQRGHIARMEAQAACVVAAGRVRRGRPIEAAGADIAELARIAVATAGSRIIRLSENRPTDIRPRTIRGISSYPCVLRRNSPTGRTRVVNGFGTFRGIRRCRRIGITPKIIQLIAGRTRRRGDPVIGRCITSDIKCCRILDCQSDLGSTNSRGLCRIFLP